MNVETPSPWEKLSRDRKDAVGIAIKISSIIIAPVRIILNIILLLLCFLLVSLLTSGHKLPMTATCKPLPKEVSNSVRSVSSFFARLLLFVNGFVFIKYNYVNGCSKEMLDDLERKNLLPKLLVANHSSYWDIMVLVSYCCPSFVSKDGVAKAPVIGPLAKAFQCIFLDRNSADSRKSVIEQIQARVMSNEYQTVLVFPEGTTSNGQALLRFNAGSFKLGQPVLPVAIKYDWDYVNPSWVNESAGSHFQRMLTRTWINHVTINILPPYIPNEEEIKDGCLYANNVQKLISEVIKTPISNQTQYDHPEKHLKSPRASKSD